MLCAPSLLHDTVSTRANNVHVLQERTWHHMTAGVALLAMQTQIE